MGDWDGMVEILAKSRSFPLTSVHLSRTFGWDLGVNGGELGLFGGDIGGFGGHLGGFGMARDCLNQDFWAPYQSRGDVIRGLAGLGVSGDLDWGDWMVQLNGTDGR